MMIITIAPYWCNGGRILNVEQTILRPIDRLNSPKYYDEPARRERKLSIKVPQKPSDTKTKIDKTIKLTAIEVARRMQNLINLWAANNFDVVDHERQYSKDSKVNDLNKAKYESVSSRLLKNTDYQYARLDLIENFGSYCSYCEIPLGSNLAVEHRLPKHYFPSLFLDYKNFLLACPVCNGIKNDKPNQVDAGNKADIDVLIDQFKNSHAWPDLYAENYNDGDPLPFEYKLYYVSPTSDYRSWILGKLVTKDYESEFAKLVSSGRSCIYNNLYCVVKGTAGTIPLKKGTRSFLEQHAFFLAVIVSARVNQANPSLELAANNIIALTSLNKVAPASRLDVTDYRMALRTRAYFRALNTRAIIHEAMMSNMGLFPETFAIMLRNTVAATGFWGVWMSVFADVPHAREIISRAFPGGGDTEWEM